MTDDVKFGMYGPFEPVEVIYETALHAEALGLDSYWLGDRLIAFPTPAVIEMWCALSALGVKTERIELGVSVTDSFRRNPGVFAQTVVAVDHISGGRVIPGIGVGEKINLVPFGIEMEETAERNRARVEEFVRVTRELWRGEPVDWDGEFFRMSGAIVQPRAVQEPHPPLWLAGNYRQSLELVGRVADGWLPAAKSPEMYADDLRVIRAEAERTGRDPDAITPGLFMYTVVDEDREHARSVALDLGRAILCWWRDSLARLRVRAGTSDLSIVNFDGTPATMERWFAAGREIPEARAAELINFGTEVEVSERVRAFVDAGVRHFVVVSLDGLGDLSSWKRTAAVFAEGIKPGVAGVTA
jgi:alkanesulfonate monooxygenase SsuD/methylene tetrahydromethanopterin reductase-like flavin-dependent oxidoreductase (luciferase family)